MKNYEIKSKNSIYFTPTVEEWIYDTFDFNIQEGMLYKILLTKKFCTWSWKYLATILRTSQSTIGRLLKKFKEMEIIEQQVMIVSGNRTRTITVPLYTKKGRISDDEAKYYIAQGIEKIKSQEND